MNNKNFDFTDIVKQGIINLYLEDSIPSNDYHLDFADILPHSDTAEGEHNVPDVLGMRRPCVRVTLLRAKRTARRKS